jgi:hypothetical protein
MKLIINEWQYLYHNGFINEAKYSDVIKKLKPKDKLEYLDKNGDTLSFEVILNDNGQIYLKGETGVYKNNFIFITISDLVNNSLSYRTINISKNLPDDLKNEKDIVLQLKGILKQFPVSTWKRSTFKNIDKILLGGENIDLVKVDAEDEKFKNFINVKDLNPIFDELKGLKVDTTYKFKLSNGGEIDLDLLDNQGDSLFFETNKLSKAAKNYSELVGAELLLDINSQSIEHKVSSVMDDENVESMYTFKFKKLKGGTDKSGNRKYDTITIKNIVDIDPVGSFNKEDKEEENKKDDNELSDKNIDKMAPEDITQLILSDPTFKAAFIKKPTFWDAILKRNPKGILAAKKILRNIGSSSSTKSDKDDKETEVTSLFKNNQEYILRLSDKSFIKDDVNIDIQKSYTVKAKKRTNTRGDITVFLYGNSFVVKVIKLNNKSNNEFSGEIIINFKKENEYRERRVFKITDAY